MKSHVVTQSKHTPSYDSIRQKFKPKRQWTSQSINVIYSNE